MKKMNVQYNRLCGFVRDIKGIIFNLVKESDYIKYNAWNKGIGMTDEEQERYDEINEQISNLSECVKYIRFAMGRLEQYTDQGEEKLCWQKSRN